MALCLVLWTSGHARAGQIDLTEGKAAFQLSSGKASIRFSRQPGLTNFLDPTCAVGGTTSLRLQTDTFDSGDISLPCNTWQRIGTHKYIYQDATAAVQGIERIQWSGGVKMLVKLTGGVANQLAGPLSFLEVRLSSGPLLPPPPAPSLTQETYCARFVVFSTNTPLSISARGPAQSCVPPATPTRTPTFTPTSTGTFTPTITSTPSPTITAGGPTLTPTGTPTHTPTNTPLGPLGSHVVTLATGSQVALKGLITLPPFPLVGGLTMNFGAPNGSGIASIDIPAASVHFNPILNPIFGINAVCVKAVANGTGFIDCDGGSTGLNQTISQDHNTLDVDPLCLNGTSDPLPAHAGVCNGPLSAVQSGTFAAGDMDVSITVAITTLTTAQFGPDMQPCTSDDQPPSPPSPVTIPVKTGAVSVSIADVNNTAGFDVALQATGNRFDCASIAAGTLTGGKLAGGFMALHADPTLGDIATVLQLVAQ